MHGDGFSLREAMRESRTSLERTMGLSFSILMSGVFSRMIRDPGGEGYLSLVQVLDSGLLALMVLALAGSMLALAYVFRHDLSWFSKPRRFYLLMGALLLLSYASGYLAADALLAAASLALASNLLLASMAMSRERLGVDVPWIVSRISDRG